MRDIIIPIRVGNVLDQDECKQLIKDASHSLSDNVRVSRAGHRKIAKLHTDTSETYKLKSVMVDLIDGQADHVEAVEVIKYEKGAAYVEHTDCLWRTHTMLVYLNDDYDGGEIRFARNSVGDVKLPSGQGLIWSNSIGGNCVVSNYHSVLSLKSGVKWVAVVWHWDRPYDLRVKSGVRP